MLRPQCGVIVDSESGWGVASPYGNLTSVTTVKSLKFVTVSGPRPRRQQPQPENVVSDHGIPWQLLAVAWQLE